MPGSSSGLTFVSVPFFLFSRSLIRKSTTSLVQPFFIGSTIAPSKRKSRYRNELAYRTKLYLTKVTKFSSSDENLVGRKNKFLRVVSEIPAKAYSKSTAKLPRKIT